MSLSKEVVLDSGAHQREAPALLQRFEDTGATFIRDYIWKSCIPSPQRNISLGLQACWVLKLTRDLVYLEAEK